MILDIIMYFVSRVRWRMKNRHNGTVMYKKRFDINRVTVGNGSYGPLYILDDDQISTVTIGCYCSIASNVTLISGSEHNLHNVSTFPFKVKCLGEKISEATSKGNIVIKDDVWIGTGAIILSGVTLGQGAVIAAGAVVVKDVPPYAIVGGNPAKVIKYRFSKDICNKLLRIDYSGMGIETIKENLELLYTPVSELEDYARLPQK